MHRFILESSICTGWMGGGGDGGGGGGPQYFYNPGSGPDYCCSLLVNLKDEELDNIH